MLTAQQLATMQAIALASFDLACTVEHPSVTNDGYGHTSPAWPGVTTVTTCALARPTGGALTIVDGSELSNLETWVVSLPLTVTVATGDRLVIGSQTLVVAALNTPESNAVVQHVIASELK